MNGAPPPSGPNDASRPRYLPIPTVRPRFTFVFLAINIVVFLLQTVTNAEAWFFFGAKINEFIVAGEWWRLITPMFLHANLVHLAFNSYALYIFGPQVEAVFGYRRFFFIYLLSGVSGAVLSFALSPQPSVGASGAIFGLVGSLLIYLFRHRQAFGDMGRRRLLEILTLAGINLVIGLSPGIDNWGHVGGLLGGATLAWLIGPIFGVEADSTGQPVIADRNRFGLQHWLAVFAVSLALGAVTAVTAALKK
ncbi:MAG: rhomboid family intramembrane serine protease [Chloroflexi bacterium]|nr:rhomboid family intramembrane serine protease [Chloroflexota bacterium]